MTVSLTSAPRLRNKNIVSSQYGNFLIQCYNLISNTSLQKKKMLRDTNCFRTVNRKKVFLKQNTDAHSIQPNHKSTGLGKLDFLTFKCMNLLPQYSNR